MKKLKGFWLRPLTLANDESGDPDDYVFYEGETIAEAISGHFEEGEGFECEQCKKFNNDDYCEDCDDE